MLNSARAVAPSGPGRGDRNGPYASFMTPGRSPGHIGLTGVALFLTGDPIGPRALAARTFAIVAP